MNSSDAYRDIVALYDLEHDSFTDDIELILQIAEDVSGPVLELGCGSGRVLQPLLEAGAAVVGIDRSEPMLNAARTRLGSNERLQLQRGDMSDLAAVPGGPFEIILSSLNSIMHTTTPADVRRMIASAYEALAGDGVLFIDTLNPSPEQLHFLLNRTHLDGSWELTDESTVDKWSHRQSSDEPQVLNTLIWYDIVNPSGVYERVRTQFDLRYVHQSELALLLELAGFQRVDWYGSYDLEPWLLDSERIIAIAHKGST